MASPKIKSPRVAPKIHAVVGSDEAEVKRVAAELAEKLTPPGLGDFGLEVIDGCADNAEQAATRIRSTIEALQTLPFMGGSKLVWLKNANFLADSIIGRAASVQSALEELSEIMSADLGDNVTFLLSATETDKRRSFYKTLSKRAEVQVIDGLDSNRSGWEEEAGEIVRARAEKRKLKFDDEALELFVLLTGGDTRQIDNELEKIDIFLGRDRQVTSEYVRELVPLSRAGVIFELGNALAVRDLERALKLVRRLPYLPFIGAVQECSEVYLDEGLIPSARPGDAVQLAFATVHGIDYLLTWNYAHLANLHTQRKLKEINGRNGWRTPFLVSPETIPKVALGQIIRRRADETEN